MRFPRSSPALLIPFALASWLPLQAQAATQCINQNAPAPLEVCVRDDGTPGVWVDQPNGRIPQYYDDFSWGSVIWLDKNNRSVSFTTQYATDYGGEQILVSPVSNTKTGSGTSDDPYVITTVVDLGSSGVRMTQRITYVNGDRKLRKSWSFENTGSTTYNNLRFFHGGDSLFGGDDSARSWYDAANTRLQRYAFGQHLRNSAHHRCL